MRAVAFSCKVAVVWTVLGASAAGGTGAEYPPRYQADFAGIEPWRVAARDFTGDGVVDLVVLHSKGIRLLEPRADGEFDATDLVVDEAATVYECRNLLAVGDWNADGLPDLAGVFGTSEVKVVLNRGNGGFQEGAEVIVAGIRSLAAGDIDGDGADDLVLTVVVEGGPRSAVVVLFSTGSGGFDLVSFDPPDGDALSAAVLRTPDATLVAVGTELPSGQPGVALATASRDRSLSPWVEEPAWANLGAEIRARDVDGDGSDELLILDREDFLAREASVGRIVPSRGVDFRYESPCIADFAFLPGLALVADGCGDSLRYLPLGDGGEILSETVYSAGGIPQCIELTDLDGDGVADATLGLLGQLWHDEPVYGSVSLIPGAGSGIRLPLNQAPEEGQVRSLALADLDGDGDEDALVSSRVVRSEAMRDAGALSILERRDGAWLERQTIPCDEALGEVEVADVNGDGIPDAVACVSYMDSTSPDSIFVFLGTGPLAFGEPLAIAVGDLPVAARVEDANGDGKPDILLILHGCRCFPGNESWLAFLAGRGDGTFEPPRKVRAGQYARDLELFDMDGDGLRDAVVLCLATETEPGLLVLRSKGGGDYERAENVDLGTGSSLLVGDVDGDGDDEFLVAGDGVSYCHVVDGRLGEPQRVTGEIGGCTAAGLGDVTGDGVADIVVAQSSWDHPVNDRLRLLQGEGGGAFRDAGPILSGLGTCDIFVGSPEPGGSPVLTAAGSLYEHRTSFLVSLPLPGAAGPEFRRGDANSDGKVDLGDAIFALMFLFLGGEEPGCMRSADVDDSGNVEITDPVFLLNYLFLGGPSPPAPHSVCGADVTQDELGCRTSPCPG